MTPTVFELIATVAGLTFMHTISRASGTCLGRTVAAGASFQITIATGKDIAIVT